MRRWRGCKPYSIERSTRPKRCKPPANGSSSMNQHRKTTPRSRSNWKARPAMTTETTLNPPARMADDRRKTLKLLAKSANFSHRWAAAAAGAAIAHTVAAGHALVQARELCEEGGWLRWLRKNFEGSVRTAQRYMRSRAALARQRHRCDARVA